MNSLRTKSHPAQQQRKRKRFPFYLALSFLIHASLIILLAILFARKFVAQKSEKIPPPEVTLEITPLEKKDRPFIEATEVSAKAPENAPFQSDQNTKAASELPPDGSLALPSQQGAAQAALELRNQKHTAGEKPASQAGSPAQPQPPSQPSLPSPAAPQTAPQKSAPTPQPSATPQPTATPQPSATPPSPTPPNNLKLLDAPKTPPPPQPTAPSSPPSPSQPPSPPVTSGTSGATKGYQPETRQTVIRGNISNRGRSSVAAEATPIGRYKKAVADAIGSRWYYYVGDRMGLLSIGTVDVSFKVSPTGKVTGLKVLRSNSNESLTDCSVRSIMDAKLPPIPPDVAATLQNGCLEIDYSFTIY
jgi:outer membrane biosynthesis protein TonB